MSADLDIFSTRVALPTGVTAAAIQVRDGRISAIHPTARPPAGAEDVSPAAILPGVVDTHVHINEPGRTDWEGFRTGSRAAAAGGTTTMVVMPLNCHPTATSVPALEFERRAAEESCIVDFGFWGGAVPDHTADLAPLWHAGVLGFKAFMAPSGIDDFGHVGEPDLDRILAELVRLARPHTSRHSPPLLVHAEDADVLARAASTARLDDSPADYARYLASRPPEAEVAAIATLIRLALAHHARVHIVHLATRTALPILREARARGTAITVETCPHYLLASAESIAHQGTIWKCAPPIRSADHAEALWSALRAGEIDMVASDHSPCPPDLKLLERADFSRAWGGIASLQLSLPLVWTGAQPRGHSLSDLARWLSAAPASLAGIHDHKGSLSPGLDADLILFDPDAAFTVDAAALHHRHPICPYHGRRLRGIVHRTYLRGRCIFDSRRGADDPFPSPTIGRWLTHFPRT